MQDSLRDLAQEYDCCYLASDVKYYITYNSESLISIIFEDHYFLGSVYAEYIDLRTINIDLGTGETYSFTKDIINIDQSFARLWRQRCIEDNGEVAPASNLPDEDLTNVLADEGPNAGRYECTFFIEPDGTIAIALTYHYNDGNMIARGWVSTDFTYDELKALKTGSGFWGIPITAQRQTP